MKTVIGIDPGKTAGMTAATGHVGGGIEIISHQVVKLPRLACQRLQYLLHTLDTWKAQHPDSQVAAVLIEHPVPIYNEDGTLRNRKGYETQIKDLQEWKNACQLKFNIWPETMYPTEWRSRYKVKNKAEAMNYVRAKLHLDIEDHNEAESVMVAMVGVYKWGFDVDQVEINIKATDSDSVKAFKARCHERIMAKFGVNPSMWGR